MFFVFTTVTILYKVESLIYDNCRPTRDAREIPHPLCFNEFMILNYANYADFFIRVIVELSCVL